MSLYPTERHLYNTLSYILEKDYPYYPSDIKKDFYGKPPSGDSPEGRQPEVPEPAKVERGLLIFHNH